MDVYELSKRTAGEIYTTYFKGASPSALIDLGRTEIASRLMVEEKLKDDAAYYAADQILDHAQELIDARNSGRPAEY